MHVVAAYSINRRSHAYAARRAESEKDWRSCRGQMTINSVSAIFCIIPCQKKSRADIFGLQYRTIDSARALRLSHAFS